MGISGPIRPLGFREPDIAQRGMISPDKALSGLMAHIRPNGPYQGLPGLVRLSQREGLKGYTHLVLLYNAL